MDPSRTSAQSGFSLLAAGVLIAILLIAALALAPVAGRQLDAQRTAQTQRALPAAFRGIFPYPLGTPGADLRTDFGYAPAAPSAFLWAGDQTPSWDLLALTSRLAVGVSDAAHNPPAAFDGTNAGSAWNGPYWTGSVDGGMRPVDGWGRPFQLRYVTSPSAGWILFSAGANGVDNTASASGTPGGDDLIYPQPPYVPPVVTATVCAAPVLTFYRPSYIPAEDVDITISWTANGGGSASLMGVKFNNGSKANGSPSPVFTNLPYGTLTISINSSKRGPLDPFSLVMDASGCAGGLSVPF